MNAGPSTAIVHDHLVQLGGAERVVLELSAALPGAPVHTALYDPDHTYPELARLPIRPSPLNRITPLRRHHRLALPLLAPVFSALRTDVDVTVCSSAGWAHGVRTRGAKVVFWHAPARWLYGPAYLRAGSVGDRVARVLAGPLRRWDTAGVRDVDVHLANSTAVAERLAAIYGVNAEVLHPPPGLAPDGPEEPVPGLEPGFLLCVNRLLPYKHVDRVVQAAAGRPLVVVGRGPDRDRLGALAGPGVRFLERVPDARMRWLYRNATLVVSAAIEDYGLVPLEAAALGTPAVVLAAGGFRDTVVEGRTGCFFERPEPACIAAAIARALRHRWDRDTLAAHAAGFAPEAFRARIRAVVAALAATGAARRLRRR